MSNDNDGLAPQSTYGSKLAGMFGMVTSEDRSKWEQQRNQNASGVSATKKAMQASSSAVVDFGDKVMHAKLDAAHRVSAQQGFDESHNKVVNRYRDPKTHSIVEEVDYTPRDPQEQEPDFEY